MTKRIGNIAKDIDLYNIVKQIRPYEDEIIEEHVIEKFREHVENDHPDVYKLPDYDWIIPLIKSGYSDPIVVGPAPFEPGIHFDTSIVYYLDKLLGAVCTQCWLNTLNPGQIAIPHRDRDGREDDLSKLGDLFRVTIHIGEPQYGQFFWIEDTSLYMQPHGEAWQWSSSAALHGGANLSYEKKRLLIYRGLIPNKSFDYEYIWGKGENSVLLKLKDGTII